MIRLNTVLAAAFMLTVGSLDEAFAGNETAPNDTPTATTGVSGRLRGELLALFRLQDMLAHGDQDARSGVARSMKRIRESLRDLQPEELSGVSAYVAAYVLSGGDRVLVRQLADRAAQASGPDQLLLGSCDFMDGRYDDARKAWKALAPEEFPAVLAGRLALAKGILARDNAEEMQEHFSLAIALTPGGLVEESALRRSALAFLEQRSEAEAWNRVTRYVRRYPNSLYLPDFTRTFASSVAKVLTPENEGSILAFAAALPPNLRAEFFLTLARSSVLSGSPEKATLASRELGKLAESNTPEGNAAALYGLLFDAEAVLGGVTPWTTKEDRAAFPSPQERALLMAFRRLSSEFKIQPEQSVPDGVTDDELPLYKLGGNALAEANKQLLDGKP